MENKDMENSYSKISPTAKIAAYWRSLSEIPFSKEIADAIYAEETAKQILGSSMEIMKNFSPLIIEARYKAIDNALKKTGYPNVLELACGLSLRGLGLAASNINYIGTDLPEILSESTPVIENLAARLNIPTNNIHFKAANVLNKQELKSAIEPFNGKAFSICNEGLLMYLNKEEKTIMANNTKNLLSNFGGVWITTDIVFSEIRKNLFQSLESNLKKAFESALKDISHNVGRDIERNDFENESEAINFYKNLGFKIETIPFYDNSYPLSTLKFVPEQAKESFLKILSESKVWILSCSK